MVNLDRNFQLAYRGAIMGRDLASQHFFCFGLGYSAIVLAERLLARGWRVSGTVRSTEKKRRLESRLGIAVHQFDRGSPLVSARELLSDVEALLSSVPPDTEGDPVLDHHGKDIAACDGLNWLGYLSTTGVYGDHAGAWVDESSHRQPTSERSRRRARAEDAWLALSERGGLPVHIFRLAGIYGPGRSVLDSIRVGQAKRIDKPGQVFGRVHVDDIATVIEASIAKPNPGAIYNVSDDEPAAPEAVVAHGCRLLGQTPPPLVPIEAANLSPMAATFYRDNKRVSNARIKTELGVSLRYPNYRAGLDAVLADET